MDLRLGYEDLMGIHANETKIFQFLTVKACYNARAYAYILPTKYKRNDVKRYSCHVDEEKKTLTVKAIPYDE